MRKDTRRWGKCFGHVAAKLVSPFTAADGAHRLPWRALCAAHQPRPNHRRRPGRGHTPMTSCRVNARENPLFRWRTSTTRFFSATPREVGGTSLAPLGGEAGSPGWRRPGDETSSGVVFRQRNRMPPKRNPSQQGTFYCNISRLKSLEVNPKRKIFLPVARFVD